MAKRKGPTKLQLKAAAIAACADKRTGRVTAEAVVEAARDPNSILHNEFEWNTDAAARAHWLETARRLIREVKLEIVYEDVKVAAPFYVATPGSDEPSYTPTTKIAGKHAAAKRVLQDEIARIKGGIHRARALAAALGLVATLDRMLDAAVEAERVIDSDVAEDRAAAN